MRGRFPSKEAMQTRRLATRGITLTCLALALLVTAPLGRYMSRVFARELECEVRALVEELAVEVEDADLPSRGLDHAE